MPTLNPRLSSHLGEQGKKHVEQARLKALGLSALEGLGAAFLAWGLLAPEEEGVAWLVDVGFVLVVMAPVVLWVASTFDGAVTPVAGFLVGCLLGTGVYFGIRTASLEPRWGVDPGGSTELQVLGHGRRTAPSYGCGATAPPPTPSARAASCGRTRLRPGGRSAR